MSKTKVKNITSKKDKILRTIFNPWWLGWFLLRKISPLIKDDKTYIRWEYFFCMKKFPNLKNPSTYNEKIQWSKLHCKEDRYTKMVCKYEAKNYVKNIIGENFIIPTLGIYNSFDEIDFDKLPNQFVLKTTHDSGGVVVCKDKNKFNFSAARAKLTKSLNHDYYLEHREYPYKNVKRRIIAEKYMADESGTELKDYKFFCFHGEPKMVLVVSGRSTYTTSDFFDIEFNHLPFTRIHPNATTPIKKPENFKEMINIARILSKTESQVRVDLYNINGKIYFGELTFFPASGISPFIPIKWDEKVGLWWHQNTEQ